MQWNVKMGRPGQSCCWGKGMDPTIRESQIKFLRTMLTEKKLDFVTLEVTIFFSNEIEWRNAGKL